MSTAKSARKIGCTTLSLAGLRLNGSEARSIFDRIAVGTSSPTFRSVATSWDGTNAVLKITSSELTGSCQSFNLTGSCPDHYGFGAMARHGFVLEKESGRCVSVRLIAARV
jgi:hypothetical protein